MSSLPRLSWRVLLLTSSLIVACTQYPTPLPSPSISQFTPDTAQGREWIVAPPLKGEEFGDWYFLRARVTSHEIVFYQLCLRDRRTGDDGWAFYENASDERNRGYATVVLARKVDGNAVMKEIVGVMLTREDLDRAEKEGLLLHINGQFAKTDAWLQPPYVKGFLELVDEHFDTSSR